MRRKKIVHLANVEQTISLFLLPQLKALQKEGFEVHAICPIINKREEITNEGIIVHHVNVTRDITFFSDIVMLIKIWWIMINERFVLAHAHSAKMEFFGQLAARLAFVPIVTYTNHGMIFRSKVSPMKKKVLIWLAKISGWLSDHIFSQSQEDIDYAQKHNIYNGNKISYLGNGIDVRIFDINNYSKQDLLNIRKELNISPSVFVVGMVARFVKEKGYVELFEAAKELLNDNKEIFFLCVGNEMKNERDPVDFSILKEMNINDHFLILKSQEDMAKLYAIMDVVVLPSYREGFPRTMMEAASMSKPTIATDISGCREVIIDNYNGKLVPAMDSKALAKALDILNNTKLSEEFGLNGRDYALKNFDQNKVVERLLTGYRKMLK